MFRNLVTNAFVMAHCCFDVIKAVDDQSVVISEQHRNTTVSLMEPIKVKFRGSNGGRGCSQSGCT